MEEPIVQSCADSQTHFTRMRNVNTYTPQPVKALGRSLFLQNIMRTDDQILKIDHQETRGYHTLTLNGEIDASSAKELDSFLVDLVRTKENNIIFDLTKVAYISSAGIGLFIYYSGELKKSDKQVIIASPTPTVKEILNLLTLEKFIPIVDTVEEAQLETEKA